jgi:galactoside 2-L-fucosyltransferase 1/2
MGRNYFSLVIPFRVRFLRAIIFLSIIIIFFFIQQRFVILPVGIIFRSIFSSKEAILSSSSPRCIVYMQHREGRLGNRMFMVASAYGLARLHACHLYLSTDVISEMRRVFVFDLSPFLLSPTMLYTLINNNSKPMIRTVKRVLCQYIPEITRPNAISQGHLFEITGYWQSYLHFAKYNNELREHIFAAAETTMKTVSQFFIQLYQQKFGVKPKFSTRVHKTLKQQLTESNDITWIGIHIRRCDFREIKYVSSDKYLFTAIDYFTDQHPKAHFIVASDDKPYCQKLFHNRSNFFITPQSFSDGDDLIALSLCEHSIVTGGTFGWWSAYLADGQVMHDKVYPSGCEKQEHYYPPWFLINDKV